MMASTISEVLSELELDALTEMVNIGVSRAAVSLREMVGEQVHLSVPSIDLLSSALAIEILGKGGAGPLVAVHQVFEGDITGRALLIFPETKSLELVRAVTGGDLSLEDIIDLEQEALAETGNILLNACLATIANMLRRSLKMSLPEIMRGKGPEFFSLAPPPEAGDVVMFLYINFTVRQRDISGHIAMLMDMPSLAALKTLLGEFIERETGGTAPYSDAPA
ncbi:MAG: chemotaxis protein CheX [Pseudomonadota bacterium]|nr:chemotaxis protein CheX [Pseudomonadota bacterium]